MDKTKISVVIFVNFPNIHITLSVQPPYAGLFAVHAPAWNRNRLLSNISDINIYIYSYPTSIFLNMLWLNN